MNDFLESIVARTRARVKNLAPACPQRAAQPFAFSNALAQKKTAIIAEIKSASPSAGSIIENPDVDAIAREYAQGGASAISIVTEPDFFHGSHDWLARAARASGLPVLMKDFIIDQRQLLCGISAGANAILLLASLLDSERIREAIEILDDFGCDGLVEVHDGRELERAIDGGARIIGVNNRNLRDFDVNLRTAERLAGRIPTGVIKVAESGIKTREDVERLRNAGFTAFLVGESLLRQNDRAAAVRALLA
ncbi:MAG: indole-3-glycerol phosphate synthase TrpC [Acidobacteria bacterium]|nr:MAG: indole-3-glycerol phosphate synthase TrpC [Acidobacteriota bacterium]